MEKPLSEWTLEELWALFPIMLTAPDLAWEKQFERESGRLKTLLGKSALGIHHIGSTAVGTIAAKPIVDILVETDDPHRAARLLGEQGYIIMNCTERRASLNKGYTSSGYADEVFHIHLRYPGDCDEIRFCTYLKAHPDTARAYEALKRRLMLACGGNRDVYTAGKTSFVTAVIHAAEEEARHSGMPTSVEGGVYE